MLIRTRLNPVFVALFAAAVLSCASSQVEEVPHLQFDETPLCQSSRQVLALRNPNLTQTLHIVGIALEAGTDPAGHFGIESIQVGSDPAIASVAGKLEDIPVPPGSLYQIDVSFSPRTAEKTSGALLTVAIDGPSEEVLQFFLDGVAGDSGCIETSVAEEVDYDGPQILQITRLVGLSQKLVNDPLTTDAGQVVHPFNPVDLAVTFDKKGSTLLFPAIADLSAFLLPPSLNKNVSNLIPNDTLITSSQSLTGLYEAAQGKIEIKNLVVKMAEVKGAFEAEMTVTLTTDPILLPVVFPVDKLIKARMNVGTDGRLAGSPIRGKDDPQAPGKVVLVGLATFSSRVTGTETALVTSLPNTQMAVQIEAIIHAAVPTGK